MLSIDDRAANVITTVALFVIAAAVLYLARVAFFTLLLSLLFAYLLEPAVTLMQRHTRLGRKNRNWAIAQVYLVGLLVLGSLGYEVGPPLVRQVKSFNAALPHILQGLSDGSVAAGVGAKHGLSWTEQQRIHDWLARSQDSIKRVFEAGAASAAYAAASTVWLFVVPILAIFILQGGRQLAEVIVQTFARGRDQAVIRRILGQVDAMLAKYTRAQLALAGFSFVFYSASMLLLRFPYPIALGLVGGVLEFLPAVGWVVSAAAILIIGFLTHAHWVLMAALLLLWRIVLSYAISPRIMGDSLQLQPLTILFAMMVGGQVGGIAGLYLSVPIVAALRIIWLGYLSADSSSDAFSGQPLAQAGASSTRS